ncbi:MAG: DUF4864 domain-containing protein [Tateyamaria sp.]|uniref:DUF4864 domain-containing protein n=1 Tax=Tateyamaria sp. TaxID=1929288 RepID=UPI0032A05FCE
MRKWIFGLVLATAMTSAAWAQSTEVESTINSQIEAFQADNFTQAFEFASPAIQGIFGTPQNFGRMVTQGFPMVWRPADVTYLDLCEINGTLHQKVQITDADGRVHLLDYRMIETDTGWKINGVQLLESADLNA